MSEQKRDLTIDIVRGLAIVTMVGANMGPVLEEPHSFFFRLYGSFAAPVFVTLAGMMVALNYHKALDGSSRLGAYLKRGVSLLFLGAFVDAVGWKILPFMSADVLYLIGISLPLAYLISHLSTRILLGIVSIGLIITTTLFNMTSYIEYPTEIDLSSNLSLIEFNVGLLGKIAKNWLTDGWFPLFPWTFYVLFGVLLGRWRWGSGHKDSIFRFNEQHPRNVALVLLIMGGGIWWAYPGPMIIRDGFSELFYPNLIGFSLFSMGIVMALIALVDRFYQYQFWRVFLFFGKCSLFIYVVHSIIIGQLFERLWPQEASLKAIPFLVIYGSFLLFLLTLSFFIDSFKKTAMWRRLHWWPKWFLGS